MGLRVSHGELGGSAPSRTSQHRAGPLTGSAAPTLSQQVWRPGTQVTGKVTTVNPDLALAPFPGI